MLGTTGSQRISSLSETVGGLLGTGRGETDGLEDAAKVVSGPSTPLCHAHNGEEITRGLDVLHLARHGPVPGEGVVALGKIILDEHLETSGPHGGLGIGNLAHVGDAITLLDTETDLTVLEVIIVVLLGHQPLIDTEDTTGLENAEDLAVDTLKSRGVDGSLDGVDGVEAVVGEVHLLLRMMLAEIPSKGLSRGLCGKTYHEVALDEVELGRKTLLVRVVGSALNLVVVVVEAGNVATGELCDFASRAADTAANIEDLHAGLDIDAVGEVVLMTSNGLVERLAVGEAAEVERLAPAIFVEISCQVVVLPGQGSVFSLTGLEVVDPVSLLISS